MLAESTNATLKNAGVKDDEIKWIGLDDFLRGKFFVKAISYEEEIFSYEK